MTDKAMEPAIGMKLAPAKIRRGSWVVYQNNYDSEPCPALVTHVWPNEEERLLNLTIFDRDGEARGATRVYRGDQVGTWRPSA